MRRVFFRDLKQSAFDFDFLKNVIDFKNWIKTSLNNEESLIKMANWHKNKISN